MGKSIIVNFSKRLRQLRKEYGYTQEKLAELSGVEYKHIQRLEGNRPCDVKLTTIEKIAKAFNLTPSQMLKIK